MKFVRFGTLKSVKQKGVKNWLSADYHKPPRRKGFYAMPYGHVNMFYIPDGWTDENMRIQFLRAEDGRKLTSYDRDHNPDEYKAALRRAGISQKQVLRHTQDAFVAYIQDPAHPPSLDSHGNPDQTPQYLLDCYGDKIEAWRIFSDKDWWTTRDSFLGKRCSFEDINCEHLASSLSGESRTFTREYCSREWSKILRRLLARRGLDIWQLCAWPVYEHGQSEELYFLKKPHTFEFSGCLWHHFIEEMGPGEILQVHESWAYTTVKALERALKKRKRSRDLQLTSTPTEVFIEEDVSAPAAPRRAKRVRQPPGNVVQFPNGERR